MATPTHDGTSEEYCCERRQSDEVCPRAAHHRDELDQSHNRRRETKEDERNSAWLK